MGKVGGFLKKNAGVIGMGVGSLIPGVGTALGGALGGAIQGAGRGAANATGLGKFNAKGPNVDQNAFKESPRSSQFYNQLGDRIFETQGQTAPQTTAAQVAPNERAQMTNAQGPERWNAAQTDVNNLGLNTTAAGATGGGNSKFSGVNMNQITGNGAVGGVAGAGNATAAVIDQTRSDEVRGRQMGFTDKLIAEEGGIASDALTRSVRQSTDRGLAAQMAMSNSARGNAGLNQRNAANNMTRVSQQGAQTGLDAFANERATARAALSSNMQATRAVDADLAAQNAGFENAVEMANAQNQTQASIATANNATSAGISNADSFARALMQNASLETQNNQFNSGQDNDMARFNAGQTNTLNMANNDIRSRVGINNTNSQNDATSQFQNLNQNNAQFNAGEANRTGIFNAGQTNNTNAQNATLTQQTNLANQAAALQQQGMNQQQIQFLLGLQQNQNQFTAGQGMDLQRLNSTNFNAAQGINAEEFRRQQEARGGFLSKLGQGAVQMAGGFIKGKMGGSAAPAAGRMLNNTSVMA